MYIYQIEHPSNLSSINNYTQPETWRHVAGEILVSLLVALVLPNVVQVVSSDDNGTFHLHALDNSSQDPTTNRHIASERALLVNVCSLNSLEL